MLRIIAGMTGQGLIGIFDSMPDRFCGRQTLLTPEASWESAVGTSAQPKRAKAEALSCRVDPTSNEGGWRYLYL